MSAVSDSRPRILVTNDDGFDAAGLAALVRAAEPLGRVFVVAPDRERSGAGHALTLGRPLRVRTRGTDRFEVDGTPTDCVHLGVFNLTDGKAPDLVLSGINRGLNIGDDVTYSGTVAAALEASMLGIPAIALSVARDAEGNADTSLAETLVVPIARRVLSEPLPTGVFLNVNVPEGTPRGVRVTRQGTRTYRAAAIERLDPSGRPYYWIAGADATPRGEPDGDHEAIAQGYVSITPLHANLTYVDALAVVDSWGVRLP